MAPPCLISYLIFNILSSLRLISFHTRLVLLHPELCYQASLHLTLYCRNLPYHILQTLTQSSLPSHILSPHLLLLLFLLFHPPVFAIGI